MSDDEIIDLDKALSCFLEAKNKKPHNGYSMAIAVSLLLLGRYTEAEKYFLEAEKLTPDSPVPNAGLSTLHDELSNFAETPENSYAWINACLAREKALSVNDDEFAGLMQKKINYLNPEFASKEVRRKSAVEANTYGVKLHREGRYSAAERAFLEAARQDPESPVPDYNLSVLYSQMAHFIGGSEDNHKSHIYAHSANMKAEKGDEWAERLEESYIPIENTGVVSKEEGTFESAGLPHDRTVLML